MKNSLANCLTKYRTPFTKRSRKTNRGDLRRLAPRKKLLKSLWILANPSALFGFLREPQSLRWPPNSKGDTAMIPALERIKETKTDYSIETLALHAGTTADPVTGPMPTP